jgi:hypothetical protein
MLADSAFMCASIAANAVPLRIVAIGASNTHGWYFGNRHTLLPMLYASGSAPNHTAIAKASSTVRTPEALSRDTLSAPWAPLSLPKTQSIGLAVNNESEHDCRWECNGAPPAPRFGRFDLSENGSAPVTSTRPVWGVKGLVDFDTGGCAGRELADIGASTV